MHSEQWFKSIKCFKGGNWRLRKVLLPSVLPCFFICVCVCVCGGLHTTVSVPDSIICSIFTSHSPVSQSNPYICCFGFILCGSNFWNSFFSYPYLQSSQNSYCFLMVTFLFKSCFWHLLPTVLSYLLLDVALCVFGFWNSWSKNWPWTPDHWISRPFSSHLMDVVSQGFFPCTVVSGHFCELLHLSHEKSFQNRIAFDDRSTVAYFILLTVVKFFAEFSSYVFFEHPLYSSGYGRPSEWRYEISVSFSVHKKAEVIKTLWRSKTKY